MVTHENHRNLDWPFWKSIGPFIATSSGGIVAKDFKYSAYPHPQNIILANSEQHAEINQT